MHLTNIQRIRKLVLNLAKNPKLIPNYVRYSLIGRQLPIQYNLPWWSFLAIDEADRLIADKNIFEFGTGGSTTRFAETASSVVAVEDDVKWAGLVQMEVDRKKLSNVEIVVCPFDFKNPENFLESDYLRTFKFKSSEQSIDIVIIDGQDWSFQERIKCFENVEPEMQEGSIVIVDDFWRYTSLLSHNRAKDVKVFESVGPCRFGVTSTAFFYY